MARLQFPVASKQSSLHQRQELARQELVRQELAILAKQELAKRGVRDDNYIPSPRKKKKRASSSRSSSQTVG